MSLAVGESVELDVGAIAHGGHCVARHEGQVVFVRHALPGERVRARVTEGGAGERFVRADAVEVLAASLHRVEPPCPYAGPGGCGGCELQHASLPEQRRLKAQVVAEQLHRLAGLGPEVTEGITVEELPGSPDGLGWRTRVQYAVGPDHRLGQRKARSHEVVPLPEGTRLAHERVRATGVTWLSWPGAKEVEVIGSASTGDALVLVTPQPGRRAQLPELPAGVAAAVRTRTGSIVPLAGKPVVREQVGARTFRVSAGGFWQVHPAAAETLSTAVLGAVRPQPGEHVLDLYGGVGLFAAPLAEGVGPAGRVVLVESDEQAVRDARRNLRDLPRVFTVRGRVETVLPTLRTDRVDAVVLDPPRAGAGKTVVAAVAARRPRVVAYVSCDPATLARDLAWFAGLGYRLDSLRAFDLFPMTAHVECLAVLTPG